MDMNNQELLAVAEVETLKLDEPNAVELSDLRLALIGGGFGDPVFI